MSRPAAWLLGLLGLAALTLLCVWTHAPAIEADLQARVTQALDPGGVSAPVVTVSGRDVTLAGTAPTETVRTEALNAARAVEGVRVVRDGIQIGDGSAAAVDGTPFSLIGGAGGGLVVQGTVPDEATREGVLAWVRGAFPDRAVDDALTVGEGTAAWAPSMEELMPVLGTVASPGVRVEGDGEGGVVVVRGRVPDEAERVRVEAAAREAIRAPYGFRSELRVGLEDANAVGGGDSQGEDAAGDDMDGNISADDQVAVSGSTDAAVQEAEAAMREVFAVGAVEFETATARLTPESRRLLDQAADVFARFPSVQAEVQGHTDSEDSSEHNQRLSELRAEAVRAYLIGQGVARDRLFSRGFGEDQPVATNDTAEGRARNRRVVFRLTS